MKGCPAFAFFRGVEIVRIPKKSRNFASYKTDQTKHITLMKLFKPIAAVCFTLVASASAFSTPSIVDLQGETFTVDTLRHYKCGPGMTRTALEYRSTTGNTRIQAFVIKTMLREAENVKFKVEIGLSLIHI